MIYGIVKGTVIASYKNAKIESQKLMVVQPLSLEDIPQGNAILALDSVQAGVGDRVLVVGEGGSANQVINQKQAPVQSVIVAVVDEINVEKTN
jgi:ethanolamine utilization protein EutN